LILFLKKQKKKQQIFGTRKKKKKGGVRAFSLLFLHEKEKKATNFC